MKKLIIIAILLATPLVSQAIVPPASNGNPLNATQPWGLTGHQTQTIQAGEKDCPIWYTQGCFDLTGTGYYKEMRYRTKLQLINNGILHLFPTLF